MGPQLLRGPLPSGKSNPRSRPLLGGYREKRVFTEGAVVREAYGSAECVQTTFCETRPYCATLQLWDECPTHGEIGSYVNH